jgi:hypothetical protein
MILVEEQGHRSIIQRKNALEALVVTPVWQEEILPFIQQLEQTHIEAAIDPNATTEDRTKHLHAIQACRDIASFPETQIRALAAQWKTKPTAQA